MKFNVVIIDSGNFDFGHLYYDLGKLLLYSIEDLGNRCTVARNRFDDDSINILLGGHHLKPADVDPIVGKHDYVFVQTEPLYKNRVNEDEADDHFDTTFIPIVQGARRVWEISSGQLNRWQDMNIPADQIHVGYHPRLADVFKKNNPDIDIAVHGRETPYRRRLIKGLEATGLSVLRIHDQSTMLRSIHNAGCRVHLVPRYSLKAPHLPWHRIAYLLNNEFIVLGDATDESNPLQSCILQSESAEMAKACHNLLAQPNPSEVAKAMSENFQQRPMPQLIEPLINAL